MIQQEPSKQQRKQHNQHPQQIRHALVPDADTDEEADHRGREIEEYQKQHEFEELRRRGHEARHGVHHTTHDYWRDQA